MQLELHVLLLVLLLLLLLELEDLIVFSLFLAWYDDDDDDVSKVDDDDVDLFEEPEVLFEDDLTLWETLAELLLAFWRDPVGAVLLVKDDAPLLLDLLYW